MFRAGFCRLFLLRAPRRRSAAAEGSEPLPSTAAVGVAAEREPPRRVAESEEVDLVPPGAGELPHKVARSGTGRSSALRRPSTVRPGAARPGLCSPLPARWLCRTCRLFLPFGFPGFPPPLFTISFPYGYGKGGKKKKRSQLKRPRTAEPCLLPNSPGLPPARPNYGQRRGGKGTRSGLRNQPPARGSPPAILRTPPGKVGLSRGWGRRGGRAGCWGCCEVCAPLPGGLRGSPALGVGASPAGRGGGCPPAAGRFRNAGRVSPPRTRRGHAWAGLGVPPAPQRRGEGQPRRYPLAVRPWHRLDKNVIKEEERRDAARRAGWLLIHALTNKRLIDIAAN